MIVKKKVKKNFPPKIFFAPPTQKKKIFFFQKLKKIASHQKKIFHPSDYSLLSPFPALFRSHNGCARTVFFASPEITQLDPIFSSRIVARYKRGSGCGALRSVFILAMPPFTTLKISPSFGFWLTDSLSENCTGPCCPPLPPCPSPTAT